MNDFIDDDFGDIYADVEVQANSAIINSGLLTNFNDNSDNLNSDSEQLNSICDEKLCISEEDDDESDSEDDFNIILNDYDNDCKGFSAVVAAADSNCNPDSIGQDEEDLHKHGKLCGSSFQSDRRKVNDSAGVVSCSSNYTRGDWEDTRCNQHGISSTRQVASIHVAGSSVASHRGYGFSLPWYRTILNVDIDAFEVKRWRFPGVDVSDFFNFGFTEDSWKQYCVSLEQLRQHSYMHIRSPNQELSKHTQACETLSEQGRATKETIAEGIAKAADGCSIKFFDVGERLMVLPKGRAIQVESSFVERQPTMDFRPARTWDSDVVIQINVQDSVENCSGSNKEEFHHIDNSGHETSKSLDDMKDVYYSSTVSADESSVKSLGNMGSSSMNGCIQQKSNKRLLDPENHVNDWNFDVDGYHNCKVNAQTSEDTAEMMEDIQKAEEENAGITCKTDQCPTETEISAGDRSHFSLTFSCSGSDSDASIDSVYCISEVSGSPRRRLCSGALQQESVSTDNESPKSNGAIRIPVDSRPHLINGSTLWEGRTHRKRRTHEVSEGRTYPDTAPMSRDRSSRQAERLHAFGCHTVYGSSYDRQRDNFSCYGVDKLADNHVKDHHRKYHQSFRDVMKAKDRRNWDEDHLQESFLTLNDRDVMYGDCVSGGRRLSPFTYKESRRLFSKYKNFRKMGIQWRRKGENKYGKQNNVDTCLLEHRNVDDDDMVLKRNGRSIPFTILERDSLDEKYDAEPSLVERGYLCGRRIQYGYGPLMNLKNSFSMDIEDKHSLLNHHHLPSWSHRKFYATSEGKQRNMMPPRITSFDSTLNEKYGWHRRESCGDKCRDSHWVDSYNDIDNAEDGNIYCNEHFHWSRKYSSESGSLHWMQNNSVWRHGDYEFSAKKASSSYEKSYRDEKKHAKYRFPHCFMVVDDIQLEWNRHKMFKGERSVGFNRKHNMMSKGECENTARKCSHPVDLILGEGKSYGRCSNAESSLSNGISERKGLKFAEERRILKDFNETHARRATQTNIVKIEGRQVEEMYSNKHCLDKIPVTKQDGHLVVEEGQIVPEETVIEDRLEKKQASRIASLTRSVKKVFHSGNETNKRYDDQQILESFAKMERRRERFKDSLADKSMKPQIDSIADTIETKQERPVRKRRWGGS